MREQKDATERAARHQPKHKKRLAIFRVDRTGLAAAAGKWPWMTLAGDALSLSVTHSVHPLVCVFFFFECQGMRESFSSGDDPRSIFRP